MEEAYNNKLMETMAAQQKGHMKERKSKMLKLMFQERRRS